MSTAAPASGVIAADSATLDKALHNKITRPQLFAYASPAFILFLLWVPVTVYLPQLYAKHTGLSFTIIGTIVVFSKVFDAITDQIIGFLSDRTKSPLGKRKPWLMMGLAVMLPSLYFLFNPSTSSGALYLTISLNGFYLGWSMILIPYSAMAPEMTKDYDERARLGGAYGMGVSLGQLTFNILPILLLFLGLVSTSEYSIEVLGVTFWLILAIAPIFILAAVIFLPSKILDEKRSPSLGGLMRSLAASPPFLIYMTAFFLFTAATGVQAAVAFTFYDTYLGIGEYLPYLVLIVVVATTFSVPVWTHISRKIGKHRALAIGWLIILVSLQGFWLLSPGPAAPFILAVVMLTLGFSQGINPVSQNAIVADLVDYGTWKTGEASAGSYYAAQAFLMKVAQAVGSGFGFILLGLVGFEVTPGSENDTFAINGLFATLIVTPSILLIAALFFIRRFPLDRRRLKIIERRIATRDERASAGDSNPIDAESA